MGFVELNRVGTNKVVRYENDEQIVGSKKWCDGCGNFRSDIKSVEIPVSPGEMASVMFCHECSTDSEASLLRSRGDLL